MRAGRGSEGIVGEARGVRRSVPRALAHPLVLLVLGAAISSVLIPAYTRNSQENREELEIRRELAERMSSAMSPMLAATLSNELVWRGKAPISYDRAYEQWSTESDVILTRLRTYIEGGGPAKAWERLRSNVRLLYYLFKVGVTPRSSRLRLLKVGMRPFLRKYTACATSRAPCLPLDNGELATFRVPPRGINPLLDHSLRNLLTIFRLETEALIDRVLASDVRL